MIREQYVLIAEQNKKIEALEESFNQFRQDVNNRFRNTLNLIEERIDIQKESNEALLIGLEKHMSQRIDNISASKTMVTDLLKKIAVLEGVKDSMEHRRNTIEVLKKLKILDEEMLKEDREEKNCSIKKAQVHLLRWILGEIDE